MSEDKELAKNVAAFIKFLRKANNRADTPPISTIQDLYWKERGCLLQAEQIRQALYIIERDGMLEEAQ